MIDSIYTRQLETVLFSINQYSDDVVSGWTSDIDEIKKNDDNLEMEKIIDFLQGHRSIDFIFFTDTMSLLSIYPGKLYQDSVQKFEPLIEEMIIANELDIKRLLQYIKSGYRKIQPVDINLPNQSLFLFSTLGSGHKNSICGFIVNTEGFIKENLGPKIQSVAQNTFFISVFDLKSNAEVYSNELAGDQEKNIEHKKTLWLFPDYELGIELKGETVEDLVKQRTYYNILIITILDLVLLLAAWFVYRAVRQEVKLAQMKSEFVSNVSHEIRTPLSIINMYSETLQMGRIKTEEKKQEYYKVINTETNRLSAIVNKILNFSKIESDKRTYNFEQTDLNKIVGQIIDNYQHHFQSKGFVCNMESTDDTLSFYGDKDAITDAVINLIDNAIKYSTDKKKIDISTGFEKGSVFIEVVDYGIGIDEKDQKLIFDKFYRVTTGDLAYKSKGSGIGLSIVKHIMDAHRGSITLVSALGQGSKFRLNFLKE